jgi:hypothetical protein
VKQDTVKSCNRIFLGFLVNSETGHSERVKVNFWAYLLTVKQDTVKTSNRILDTLWEASIFGLSC